MERTVHLTLQPRETFVLAQYLRHMVPDGRPPHVSSRFLLDFGLAFLHQVGEDGRPNDASPSEHVPISEEDVLSLRELVPLNATLGGMAVGVSIHRKLYEALLRLHPEHASELRFVEVEEPTRGALGHGLQHLSHPLNGAQGETL